MGRLARQGLVAESVDIDMIPQPLATILVDHHVAGSLVQQGARFVDRHLAALELEDAGVAQSSGIHSPQSRRAEAGAIV